MGICGSDETESEPERIKQKTPGGTTKGGTDDGLFVELNYSKKTAQSVADRQMVKEWLQCIVELPQYFDLFSENGYESIKFIKTMSDKSELREIGITKLGHQTLPWSEIKNLKEHDEAMKCAANNRKLNQNMHQHQQYNSYNQNHQQRIVPIVVEGAGNYMPNNAMMHNTNYTNTQQQQLHMYTNSNHPQYMHNHQQNHMHNGGYMNANVNVEQVPGATVALNSTFSTDTNDDMYGTASTKSGFSFGGTRGGGPTAGYTNGNV